MPDSALGSLFKRGILTDITLVVEGKEIPTHRAILAAHSPFFEGLFTSGMSETNESKVTLHSPFRYRATYQIIAYLYDGMTYEQNFNAAETKVDFELLWDTFLLAEYLTLPVIQQKMVPYLLQGLNRETALQILQSSYGKIDKSWAKLHGDVFHFVAAHCVEFLKDFPDVMRTLEKPLLMDIIRAACLKTCVRGNGFQTSEIDTIVGFLKNYTNCDSMAGLLGLCKNWPSKRYKPAVTCWQVPNWMHVLRGGRVPTMSVRTDSLLLHFKLKRMSETEIAVVQEICRPSSARSDDDGRLSLYSCAHTEFSIWKKQPPDFGNSSTEEDVNVTSLTCCSTLGDYPVRSSSREIRHTIYNTDFGTGLQHPENDGGDESIHLVEDLCWSEQNRSWYDIVSMSTALETPGGGTGALYVRLSVSENPIAAVLMEHISANFIHFWRTEQIILDLDTTERECLINAVCNASMTSDDENKPEGEAVLRMLCDIAEERGAIPRTIFDLDVLTRCVQAVKLEDLLTALFRHNVLSRDRIFMEAVHAHLGALCDNNIAAKAAIASVVSWVTNYAAAEHDAALQEIRSLRSPRAENEFLELRQPVNDSD